MSSSTKQERGAYAPRAETQKHTRKVAIIGAGPSGLATARRLAQIPTNDLTIFERTDRLGGVWHYTPKPPPSYFTKSNRESELLKNEEDVYELTSNPMYHDLLTNQPREIAQFPGFNYSQVTCCDSFDKRKNEADNPGYEPHSKSFMSVQEVHNYICNFAEQYDLLKYVKFNSTIDSIARGDDCWFVNDQKFDVVIVAAGIEHFPNPLPMEVDSNFPGPVFHSSNFDHIDEFENKNVLLLGVACSGNDLAERITKVCKKLLWCPSRKLQTLSRDKQKQFVTSQLRMVQEVGRDKVEFIASVKACNAEGVLTFADNKRPPVDKVERRTKKMFKRSLSIGESIIDDHDDDTTASDGEQIIKTDVPDKVDAIIWATGYGYVWPCIDKDADFYPNVFDKDNGGRGCNLDLGLMSPQYPTSLFFVGLQESKAPFPHVDTQATVIAKTIALDLPLDFRREPELVNPLNRFEYFQLCRLFNAGDVTKFNDFVERIETRKLPGLPNYTSTNKHFAKQKKRTDMGKKKKEDNNGSVNSGYAKDGGVLPAAKRQVVGSGSAIIPSQLEESWPHDELYLTNLHMEEFCLYEDVVIAIRNFLTDSECNAWIEHGDELGFESAVAKAGGGMAARNSGRIVIDDENVASSIFSRLQPFLPNEIHRRGGVWQPFSCAANLRLYKYEVGQRFAKHFDSSDVHSEDVITFQTVLIYLNGGVGSDLAGGSTNFYE
eukprot:gene756-306_t